MKSQYTNKNIVGADAILRVISENSTPMGITEVASEAELSKDFTLRALATMEELRWVERVGDRYKLGMALALLWARKKTSLEEEQRAAGEALSEIEIQEDI